MTKRARPGFMVTAIEVLRRAERPLHPTEITARAIKHGLLRTEGKTPANTMRRLLKENARREGQIVATSDHRYSLRKS